MSSKTKWPQAIAEFLVDNLAILLTVGYAGFIIYRQQIAKMALTAEDLLTAILTILGLLAMSEIVERYRRLNSIEKAVNRSLSFLESRLTDHPSAIAFFQEPPRLDHYVQSANHVDLCGVTLTSTLQKQFGNLSERVQAGAEVRILVVDPASQALKMSAARSVSPDDTDYYRVRLDATFREMRYLFQRLEEFKAKQGNAPKAGKLSVRLLSYAPSFGIISFDARQDNGIVFVELYPHKYGHKSPPIFDLMPKRDGNWYRYFIDQFDEMWNAAKAWDPQTSRERPA